MGRDNVVTEGVWLHYAGTWNGSELCVFLDGAEDDCNAHGGTMNGDSRPFWIGANANNSTPGTAQEVPKGLVDEVRLSLVNRGADWISAERDAAMGSMVSLGPIESL